MRKFLAVSPGFIIPETKYKQDVLLGLYVSHHIVESVFVIKSSELDDDTIMNDLWLYWFADHIHLPEWVLFVRF